MKLSELSYREYIALEALPAFVGNMLDKDAAWRAFSIADEFLKRAGREHDKIAEIKRECDKLEIQNSLLRNMNAELAARAPQMTEALELIRDWPSDLSDSLRELAAEALK